MNAKTIKLIRRYAKKRFPMQPITMAQSLASAWQEGDEATRQQYKKEMLYFLSPVKMDEAFPNK